MIAPLVIGQIQEQMNAAVECINDGRFLEGKAAFLECAQLVDVLQMEKEIPSTPKPEQLTIDIKP
jgi:hypothetical protein